MSAQLVCPHCGSGDSFYSIEKATIGYPATFTEDGPAYTGGASQVYDEGTEFDDDIDCRACSSSSLRLQDLVPVGEDAPTLHELADEPEMSAQ